MTFSQSDPSILSHARRFKSVQLRNSLYFHKLVKRVVYAIMLGGAVSYQLADARSMY